MSQHDHLETHRYRVLQPRSTARRSAWAIGCRWLCVVGVVLIAVSHTGQLASAAKIVMRDGRIFEGRIATVSKVAEDPRNAAPDSGPKLILLVDDQLRRYFLPKRMVAEVLEEAGIQAEEKFTISQAIPRAGPMVGNVGSIVGIEPFDEFGRRIFRMNSSKGDLNVIQGITEITPLWTKVEGISHRWDMRVATSSIPRDTLDALLLKQVDPQKVDDRLKVARLYLQSERFGEAREQLEQIQKDFPDLANQVRPVMIELRQLGARRLLDEVKKRADSGQHRLAYSMLEQFPSEDVAGELLQQVRERVTKYQTDYRSATDLQQQYEKLLGQLEAGPPRDEAETIGTEIFSELNNDTLDRMAAFKQFLDDSDMEPDEKLALAISGWLVGSNHAQPNLPVATAMWRTRNLVARYLIEEAGAKRQSLMTEIGLQEGASPETLARLLAHMKPPYPLPTQASEIPGFYDLKIPGITEEPHFRYVVQLPPEYNPHRHYPTIVTLNGRNTTPEQQVDWWAGAWSPERQMRQGQATRHGYIVIAPSWTTNAQNAYRYSAREHALVLSCLRDAVRRFSVDTDRVFLSGHSIGGDAAWDLGLAHPDTWAGVIPVVATADKFCAHYWENAEYVPFYIVGGELDNGRTVYNSRELDRYLRRGFDTTFVEFRGRGHEHFSDEVQQIFDWMGRKKRDFFPHEFTGLTMRPWDNYFWWVEVDQMPARVLADPADWPPPRGTRPMSVEGRKMANGDLSVRTGAEKVTIWLAPQLVDLDQRFNITVNGRRVALGDSYVEPSMQTMLEDVRTRGDRRQPFWAKITWPQ